MLLHTHTRAINRYAYVLSVHDLNMWNNWWTEPSQTRLYCVYFASKPIVIRSKSYFTRQSIDLICCRFIELLLVHCSIRYTQFSLEIELKYICMNSYLFMFVQHFAFNYLDSNIYANGILLFQVPHNSR